MRYVSPKFERQLENLAEHLLRPVGDAALQDTIEFDPIPNNVVPFPPTLRLRHPVETGWDYIPPTEAA